jgi:hypothetical protein
MKHLLVHKCLPRRLCQMTRRLCQLEARVVVAMDTCSHLLPHVTRSVSNAKHRETAVSKLADSRRCLDECKHLIKPLAKREAHSHVRHRLQVRLSQHPLLSLAWAQIACNKEEAEAVHSLFYYPPPSLRIVKWSK